MKTIWMAAAVLAGAAALPAEAVVVGFTGPYAPATWTTTTTGNLGVANSGSASNNGTTLVLTGGNAVSPDPGNFASACTGASVGQAGNCQISYVTTTIQNNFAFNWTYVTADTAGANDDLFGLLIDGVRVQLSDPGGAVSQSGSRLVSASSSFGWYINCTDCIEGAATATITNFRAAVVPEPATMALIGFGVVAGGAARRKHRARKPAAMVAA